MNAKICSPLLVLLIVSGVHAQQRINYPTRPWGRLDYAQTYLTSEKCDRVTRLQNREFRVCPSVAGYQLLFGGNEASPQVIIVTPNRKQHVIHYWDVTSDDFISLNKEVTWTLARYRSGKVTPLSVSFEVNVQHDEFTRFRGAYTVIAKVNPKQVCVTARVPAGPSAAAYIAGLREPVPSTKCVRLDDLGEKDWLGVVFGLSSKGRYDDAKSVINQILSPSQRTVGYVNIARDQAENGYQPAARTTLLQGLDDVLNQKDITIFPRPYGGQVHESSKNDNLLSILSTMAEVGLYDDAFANLKFVNNSELPRTLLWIGKVQGTSRSRGGRGDIKAAVATFKRAVELELTRADTTAADGNLIQIVQAQIELGLLTDAKQTVLLIKNSETRKVMESNIALYEKQPQ